MAVFQRPGRKVWWFEFEYRGRRYRESAGTHSKTLAVEIERKRRRNVEESANGVRRNKSAAVLFSVAASDWLSLKKPTWADKTYTIETANVGHLRPHLGKLLLTDITDHDIARYQEQRRQEKAANKTINNEVVPCGQSCAAIGCGRKSPRTCGCCARARMSAVPWPSRRKKSSYWRAPQAVRGASYQP
jgi:hypothetical protein